MNFATPRATPSPGPGRGASKNVAWPRTTSAARAVGQNSGTVAAEKPKETVERFGGPLAAKFLYSMVGYIAPLTKIYILISTSYGLLCISHIGNHIGLPLVILRHFIDFARGRKRHLEQVFLLVWTA